MDELKKESLTWLDNRERKLMPKRGFNYCICDRALIGDSQKCPKCGRREKVKRRKK